MSVDIRNSDRRRYMNELQVREKEIAAGLLKASQPPSPKAQQENEKRMRREIANSNERRRMQCINAGFSSLRALIPQLEGEKLSKAAILQHATEYITSLEKDKSRLQIQLDHTKGLLSELGQDRVVADAYVSSSPPPSKRKKRDTESSDEGVCSLSDASDDGGSELQQENVALRHQVEVERQRCATLEERIVILEAQLMTLLHVQNSQHDSLNELRAVTLECRQLRHESLCNREVVEVIASREAHAPSPWFENCRPSRPRSPTPERGLPQDSSVPLDATTVRSLVVDSTRYSTIEPVSSPVSKMDVTSIGDNFQGVVSSAVPMATTTVLPVTEQSSNHHHNYCHRDHPRRRHRQQARLEQQREEEELRRQQQKQEETSTAAAPFLYQPKQNTQNLEKLVEAIRQIEGDQVLCKFYADDYKQMDTLQNGPHMEESERETSSMSDQDELKSESSGRDSPLHRHHLHQNITPIDVLTSSSSSLSTSSTTTFLYPVASHLLHPSAHPSFCRPGVIVHKQ